MITAKLSTITSPPFDAQSSDTYYGRREQVYVVGDNGNQYATGIRSGRVLKHGDELDMMNCATYQRECVRLVA